ncbi:MAG TPA: oligosaccharide flippase family protein [Verrucomicrobiota bacterium]|nr:hypothetical protein [Verrucomicrobiales bacterium]HRI15183.1 oligosaccharide flippase family protein [Verrucomicrobiota bacterium]
MHTSSEPQAAWGRVRSVFLGSSGRSRLARAISWNIAGGATSRIVTVAGSYVVARCLGEKGFGQLGMVINTFTMLGVFASFGLGMTATRFISIWRTSAPERAGRIAAFAPILAATFALAGMGFVLAEAPWLARAALNAPDLVFVLRLAAPLLLLGALQDVAQGILAGAESFRALARVSAMAGLALALGMMIGAVSFGLPGSILGMVIGMSLGCALSLTTAWWELKRLDIPVRWTKWRSELPTLWSFALPAALSGSVVIPVTWLANAILVHQPGGYDQMGVFNAANQWRNLILYVPTLVASAGLPVLANLWQTAGGSEYLRVLRLKMGLGFVGALAVAVPVMLAAPFIMKGYGRGFSQGTDILIVLAGAAVILATLTMVGQALVSEGRMWTGFLLNCVWAAVLLVLAMRWVPAHGALGLAWANLGAFGVHFVTVSGYFWWSCRTQRRTTNRAGIPSPVPPPPSTDV